MNDEKLQPPSELFERAVLSAGNLVATCDLCQRVHFATATPGLYEEGELEDLRDKAKKKPDRYMECSGDDSLSVGFLDNQRSVLGCPCNRLRKYEDFIWNNRRVIVQYIKSRVAARREEVSRDEGMVEGLEA